MSSLKQFWSKKWTVECFGITLFVGGKKNSRSIIPFVVQQFTPRTFLIRNVIYKCFSSQIGGSIFFKGVAASHDLFLHHANRKRGGVLSPKWLNNRGGGVVKIFRSGRGGGMSQLSLNSPMNYMQLALNIFQRQDIWSWKIMFEREGGYRSR